MQRKCRNFLSFILLGISLCACTTTQSSHDDSDANKKLIAANANVQLGMDYLQAGDVRTAKQKLLEAMDLAPDYAPAWYAMAYYLESIGENQKANEDYLHAIDLAPHRGDTQNNYGTFLCHTGKPKEAISHFLKATEDPDYLDTAAAYENAGLCALQIPDPSLAKLYFTKALKQDPKRSRSALELEKLK